MTLAITHSTVVVVPDDGTSPVGTDEWNAAHTLTGTVSVAQGGTGTATALTQGSVVFAGASGVYSQNNTALFWDDTNHALRIAHPSNSTGQRLFIRATHSVSQLGNSGTEMVQGEQDFQLFRGVHIDQLLGPDTVFDDPTVQFNVLDEEWGEQGFQNWIGYPYASGPPATVTISIASPGVVTFAGAHGLALNQKVYLVTTGALPTGLTATPGNQWPVTGGGWDTGTGTLYYVKTMPTSSTLTLSATAGGAIINTSGSQSGVHTLVAAVSANVVNPAVNTNATLFLAEKLIQTSTDPSTILKSFFAPVLVDIQSTGTTTNPITVKTHNAQIFQVQDNGSAQYGSSGFLATTTPAQSIFADYNSTTAMPAALFNWPSPGLAAFGAGSAAADKNFAFGCTAGVAQTWDDTKTLNVLVRRGRLQMGLATSSSAGVIPGQIFLSDWTSSGSVGPSFVWNSNTSGYGGLGPATTSADNRVWFGQTTNVSAAWDTNAAHPLHFEVFNGSLGLGSAGTVDVYATRSAAGVLTLSQTVGGAANVQLTAGSVRGAAVTFANVPATPVEGMLVAVTDSTTAVWGNTITGTGGNHVLAYYNGTNWTVAGK